MNSGPNCFSSAQLLAGHGHSIGVFEEVILCPQIVFGSAAFEDGEFGGWDAHVISINFDVHIL